MSWILGPIKICRLPLDWRRNHHKNNNNDNDIDNDTENVNNSNDNNYNNERVEKYSLHFPLPRVLKDDWPSVTLRRTIVEILDDLIKQFQKFGLATLWCIHFVNHVFCRLCLSSNADKIVGAVFKGLLQHLVCQPFVSPVCYFGIV